MCKDLRVLLVERSEGERGCGPVMEEEIGYCI